MNTPTELNILILYLKMSFNTFAHKADPDQAAHERAA